MAILLPSLWGGQPLVAPAQPLVRETTPVEIINIFDDDEEIDWDLLRRDSDEEEKASVAGERAGRSGRRPQWWLLRFLLRLTTAQGPFMASASVTVGRG